VGFAQLFVGGMHPGHHAHNNENNAPLRTIPTIYITRICAQVCCNTMRVIISTR